MGTHVAIAKHRADLNRTEGFDYFVDPPRKSS